jgi:hypothetical protein
LAQKKTLKSGEKPMIRPRVLLKFGELKAMTMHIILLLLISGLFAFSPAVGQADNWGAGIYNRKHSDLSSATTHIGALAEVPQQGVCIGLERRYGLPELDAY